MPDHWFDVQPQRQPVAADRRRSVANAGAVLQRAVAHTLEQRRGGFLDGHAARRASLATLYGAAKFSRHRLGGDGPGRLRRLRR